MELTKKFNNEDGFTLVEIIAVLIILGILAAVAVPRYINLESTARIRAIDAAVSELNGRENLIWANVKIGSPPPTSANVDTNVWTQMSADISLGSDYAWDAADLPDAGGGTISFQGGDNVVLTRVSATLTAPASWTAP